MLIDAVAERVSSLPPYLLNILACLSEGMSNRQIAEALGYKNARTVGTLVSEINKKLRLKKIYSRIEQRKVAADAFRIANTGIVRIKILPHRDATIRTKTITLNADTAERMSSLVAQGYKVETLEVVLRKHHR